MRNLKRALSLALASIMVMGLMVVGTSAASYPDVDSADNLEAIEVLKLVGIMEGDEKGNFNPDKMVTRNEMAVVMVNLLGLTPGGTSPFTDVPSWAQPYVAACYNNDIIAGVSKTSFNGDANVTAVQAGLMVMKALGYFGYQGEFGDSWKLAVVKQADKIDLYRDVNAYTDQDMSRNDVAQMVLNALECTIQVVREQGGLNVEGNGITVNQKPTYSYADADNRDGVDYRGTSAPAGATATLQLCEKLYGTDLKQDSTSASDTFGRPSVKWTYKSKSVTTPKAPDLTYTKGVKGKDIYNDLGKLSGTSMAVIIDTDADGTPETAGIYVDGRVTALPAGFNATSSTSNTKIGGNGTVTEVYYDPDTAGKPITIVVINTYLAQAVADYDEVDDELTIGMVTATGTFTTDLDGEDFDIADYVEDDYILVNAKHDGAGNYDVKKIAPATVVEDVKVNAYKSNDYVTAGGQKYEYNVVTNPNPPSNVTHPVATGDILGEGQIAAAAGSTYILQDASYNLILDANDYVIGVEPFSDSANLNNYLFVKQAGGDGLDVRAKVVFMDGTSQTVTISKTAAAGQTLDSVTGVGTVDTAIAAGAHTLNAGRFYTYTVNKNGEYNLTDVANQEKVNDIGTSTDGTVMINPDAATFAAVVNGSARPANNKTVFVAKDKAYTGVKSAPEVLDAPVYCLYNTTNAYMLAAFADKKGVSSTDSTEYVYILNATAIGYGEDDDDNLYYIYDAVVDGVKTTINASNATLANGVGLYAIDSYTEGYADLDHTAAAMPEAMDVTGGAATANGNISYRDGTLTVGANTYVLDDEVKFIYIDGTDSDATKTVSAGYMNSLRTGTYLVEMVKVSSTDNTITTVYVDRQT